MAPTLPSSLSPHVCILSSPDLQDLLEASSLPPLPQLLQAFSPLSQVTTRTTSLTSVPHSSFALRFSDLTEIETATHEDDEQRAGRTFDWINARVVNRCGRWVEMVEAAAGKDDGPWKDRTPWWEEVKRCIDGDHVPSKTESWNHPVAIIFAVSTMAVNPLQALQDLHSRAVDLPPWVDANYLRYSLIVHPANSPLSDPIADSLYNAVKKQYGLHSYMLSVGLPTSPLPPPVPVPFPVPRLPPASPFEFSPMPAPQPTPTGLAPFKGPAPVMSPAPRSPAPPALNGMQGHRPNQASAASADSLILSEEDISQIARFVRELVVMSVVPWMEKCVVEWNEVYSSSRRLPSRLFSSTRRLFGASYTPSPTSSTPTHSSNTSISSTSSRFGSHAANSSVSSLASITSTISAGQQGAVLQQRRLAEFATILGDFKLAVSVWETLRKESKGGSDILPILLSPSPAFVLNASNALAALNAHMSDTPALVQLRALVYAVRWEIAIERADFLGSILEGDRWLVQAAGAAEEPPAAILLAHAAFLSIKRGARRRAALWYLCAADRLEKTGVKPLAMYFFRQSHQLYTSPPEKELSPSFWDSEDGQPIHWRGFDAVLPGIEHELGRLLYTTGDTEGAVRHFLGLLQDAPRISASTNSPQPTGLGLTNGGVALDGRPPAPDKIYLEDFRVALQHFKATEAEKWAAASLKLPIAFCQVKQTRVRLPGDTVEGDPAVWSQREEDWATFWKPRGKEQLEKSGKAAVGETFRIDLLLRNPLDVEVVLSNLTVVVKEAAADDEQSIKNDVEVEVVDDVVLGGRETRTIPISLKCLRPATLAVTQATYDFLSLLPAVESLATRGRRLHDTPAQRQSKVYAPDVLIKIEVEDAGSRLNAKFVDDRHLVLAQGEHKRMSMRLSNSGTRPIGELWMVPGPEDEIWVDVDVPSTSAAPSRTEVLRSSNSFAPRKPYRIPIETIHESSSLGPGESLDVSMILHASGATEQDLSVLLVFREVDGPFRSTRLTRQYEVKPIFETSASSRPSRTLDHSFLVNLEVENSTASTGIRITQITTLSPTWTCEPLTEAAIGDALPTRQVARVTFGAKRRDGASGVEESIQFVSRKLKDVLRGDTTDKSEPPPIELHCVHSSKDGNLQSVNAPAVRHFIHSGRRNHSARVAASSHPHIPSAMHHSIFPLYHPSSVDVLVFWDIPAQGRSGHVLLTGLNLGAGHAPLKELVEEAESAKVKRNMFAETQREREDIVEAIKNCEWNAEMNPIVVTAHAGGIVEHDFSKGPFHVPVAFSVRNHSLTNPSRFVLKLTPDPPNHSSSELLPPQYAGRLTHRGELEPSQSTTVQAKFWVTRPGIYALNGWSAETEVGEVSAARVDSQGSSAEPAAARWQVRQRYQQGPPAGDRSCITVVDIGRS